MRKTVLDCRSKAYLDYNKMSLFISIVYIYLFSEFINNYNNGSITKP